MSDENIQTDDQVLGQLEAQEMAQLNALRKAAHDYTFQLGQLRIQEARILEMVNQTEMRAQGILNGAAKRLNIPEGEAWVAGADGSVRLQAPAPGA